MNIPNVTKLYNMSLYIEQKLVISCFKARWGGGGGGVTSMDGERQFKCIIVIEHHL